MLRQVLALVDEHPLIGKGHTISGCAIGIEAPTMGQIRPGQNLAQTAQLPLDLQDMKGRTVDIHRSCRYVRSSKSRSSLSLTLHAKGLFLYFSILVVSYFMWSSSLDC